jgi:hypothetical protein
MKVFNYNYMVLKNRRRINTMKYAVEGIYRNGVVEWQEDAPVNKTTKVIVLFKEELNAENMDWLKLSESAFVFWDNEEDAYYDNL